MNFYVYSILDPRKPGTYKYGEFEFTYEPIYIGKGRGNRLNEHLHSNRLKKNDFKNNKIKRILDIGLKPILIKLKENLNEEDSFILEKQCIEIIKRYPDGPLTNLTDGGEGVSGLKHTKESLDKMSSTWFYKGHNSWNKGMKMSKEHCDKLRVSHTGNTLSEETKKKLSKHRKGKSKSLDHKRKISESLCKKKYLITSPSGTTKIVPNYNKFCKENNLSVGSMSMVLNGKKKSYKGFKISCCVE